jgi:hypothetical protein
MSKHGRSWSSSDKEEAHPSWWGKQRKMEDRGYSAVDDTNDEEALTLFFCFFCQSSHQFLVIGKQCHPLVRRKDRP